jgi:hypothetical protein
MSHILHFHMPRAAGNDQTEQQHTWTCDEAYHTPNREGQASEADEPYLNMSAGFTRPGN